MAETRRSFTTCLHIIVSNYSVAVGMYVVTNCIYVKQRMWHKAKNTTENKIYDINLTLGANKMVYIIKIICQIRAFRLGFYDIMWQQFSMNWI